MEKKRNKMYISHNISYIVTKTPHRHHSKDHAQRPPTPTAHKLSEHFGKRCSSDRKTLAGRHTRCGFVSELNNSIYNNITETHENEFNSDCATRPPDQEVGCAEMPVTHMCGKTARRNTTAAGRAGAGWVQWQRDTQTLDKNRRVFQFSPTQTSFPACTCTGASHPSLRHASGPGPGCLCR